MTEKDIYQTVYKCLDGRHIWMERDDAEKFARIWMKKTGKQYVVGLCRCGRWHVKESTESLKKSIDWFFVLAEPEVEEVEEKEGWKPLSKYLEESRGMDFTDEEWSCVIKQVHDLQDKANWADVLERELKELAQIVNTTTHNLEESLDFSRNAMGFDLGEEI